MAATMAQVKPLKGKKAEKFSLALQSSQIKDEAIKKILEEMKKSLTKNS